jgi:hypothetical protein
LASLSWRLGHHQKTQTEGVIEMKGTGKRQATTAAKKAKLAADYQQNWRSLEKLLSAQWISFKRKKELLEGLRPLNPATDIIYYIKDGQDTEAYMVTADDDASWIWRMEMLGMKDRNDVESNTSAVRVWIKEGGN